MVNLAMVMTAIKSAYSAISSVASSQEFTYSDLASNMFASDFIIDAHTVNQARRLTDYFTRQHLLLAGYLIDIDGGVMSEIERLIS